MSELLPHIIEMKEAIARVEENTRGLPERVNRLEHKDTARKAIMAFLTVLAGFIGFMFEAITNFFHR